MDVESFFLRGEGDLAVEDGTVDTFELLVLENVPILLIPFPLEAEGSGLVGFSLSDEKLPKSSSSSSSTTSQDSSFSILAPLPSSLSFPFPFPVPPKLLLKLPPRVSLEGDGLEAVVERGGGGAVGSVEGSGEIDEEEEEERAC